MPISYTKKNQQLLVFASAISIKTIKANERFLQDLLMAFKLLYQTVWLKMSF